MKKICLLLSLTAIYFDVNAQFQIYEPGLIDKVKKGTTYIVMKDTSSANAKPFKDVFRKYWAISKIEFITRSQINDHISKENSFLSMEGKRPAIDGGEETLDPDTKLASIADLYLSLWVPSEDYFKMKKKRSFTVYDQARVATIRLYVDPELLHNPTNIFQLDYDGEGHIRNWGPGILKNDIQQLTIYLNEGKKRNAGDETVDKAKIIELASKTLFVPDYVLFHFNKGIVEKNETKVDEKELFKNYKFLYQLLSIKELNDKILNSREPFYYFTYVKVENATKYLSVVDSSTGVNIYIGYDSPTWNIDDGDLKKLSKKIK